jgi:hypothetical protein
MKPSTVTKWNYNEAAQKTIAIYEEEDLRTALHASLEVQGIYGNSFKLDKMQKKLQQLIKEFQKKKVCRTIEY